MVTETTNSQNAARVAVAALVGSRFCVSIDDGELVHDKVLPLLKQGRHVVLSFQGVTDLISSFLNAAVGRLYGELDEAVIKDQLSFADLSEDDRHLIERVVENAKSYFANRDAHDQAFLENLGEDDVDEE